MDWLNYHHLYYFWMVAKEGSYSRAAERLHLAQPTLSSQIKKLEKSLGVQLFRRVGRSIELTELGHVAFRHADEIFALGQELVDAVHRQPHAQKLKLVVGVPDVMPKLVIYRLLRPALAMDEHVQIECHEGKLTELLGDLALHRLDLVLADSPLTPQVHVRAFNHLLGESHVTIFGTKKLARQYRADFPRSLDDAPMILPTQNTALRRSLEQWFDQERIRPDVRHEIEDSAVLKVFGQAGQGLFPAPSVVQTEICHQYGVQAIGILLEVTEKFYAISVERRIRHPAVLAISRGARDSLELDI